jgi:hypothetical protein
MANKSRSKSQEAYFSKYASTKKQASNRKQKLLRLQKEQPNNLQVIAALNDIHYRRGTPKTPYWSHQMIAQAKLFKEFLGKFDKLVFSTDQVISSAASKVRNAEMFKQFKQPSMPKYSIFSIRARLVDGDIGWK